MSTLTEDLSEFHDELSTVARDVLATTIPGEAVDWNLIAGTGWLGLEVPTSLDGEGAGFAEVAVILREIGRAAAGGPYPAVAGAAVGALTAAAPSAARDLLLRAVAAGDAVPVLVLDAAAKSENAFRVDEVGDGFVLNGTAEFVLGGAGADTLLVPVTVPGGAAIVAVPPTTPGVVVEPREVVDATRDLARVTAESVAVRPDAVWRLQAPESVSALRDRAAVAVACDSLGVAEAMLEATVDHVTVREQFGRAIGSFQAVKHACADMLVNITVARRLVASAVGEVAGGGPGAVRAASMAKSFTSEIAVEIAGKAMQLHGGMGYTWESGIHVYLKRATLNRNLYGSPAQHRAVIAEGYRNRR
ncbi:acyl-CoA dehydrogenase family protein [Gordonia sp. LSe1-13]|uniref:Acyl-CoA dehydrogenase family protein n=1 Tax=Gordonia sesuvii TaxID=3116777 RepID=A0ABU7M7N5_9ACTN|nr:acyl-CoA dehydrogenase family protein [Gordonia sp. LSe1-13]